MVYNIQKNISVLYGLKLMKYFLIDTHLFNKLYLGDNYF